MEEPRPLGTGGALKYAEDLLDERFLMLNGDVLTDIDVSAQIAAHERTGARATLALYPVEDPSAYGLVRLEDDGAVREFVEKPAPDQIDTNNISAGVYVLERSVLELLEAGEPASIERDVFPQLVGNGLYGHVAQGYWKDIGTPERYWRRRSTSSRARSAPRSPSGWGRRTVRRAGVEAEGRIVPAALVEAGCQIAEGARVGGRAVLEHGVVVGEGTTIEGAVVMQGTEIGANCTLRGCIIAGGVRIGDNCVIDGMSVLGEGVTLGAGNTVSNGARLFPGVTPAGRRPAVLMDLDAGQHRTSSARSSGSRSTCATRCGVWIPRGPRRWTRRAG